MKIGKILILVAMTYCLVLASVSNISAADVTKTLYDDKDDVIDEMTGEIISKPNIDIRQLVATQ